MEKWESHWQEILEIKLHDFPLWFREALFLVALLGGREAERAATQHIGAGSFTLSWGGENSS